MKTNILSKIAITVGLLLSFNTVYADRTANGVPGDGVIGYVLKSLGGGDSIWVATSTLGFGVGGWTFSSSTIWGLFSNSATGLTYNNGTGATTLTAGYNIPLTASTTNWNNFFNASSTYSTYAYGTSTYATILNYPTYAYASSTFASTTWVNSTFVPYTGATSNLNLGTRSLNTTGLITSTSSIFTNSTTTDGFFSSTLRGAGLTTVCNATTEKLLYSTTTGQFYCGTDAGAGGGITSLNTLTAAGQTFASSSSGTDFAITSAVSTHTFQMPSSSGSARGLLTSTDWTTFNNKVSNTYASSTFPSFTYGSSTYYFASNPSGYITTGVSTLSNYPTYTYASSTFASTTWVTSTFPTYAYASSTFASTTWVTNTFATKASPTLTGTTTATDIRLTGGLYDQGNTLGTANQILRSTGTSTQWVSTSTLFGAIAGGITSLNGDTTSIQTFATTTTGTDFGVTSSGGVHTFRFVDASATARGLVTTGTQTFAGAKTFGNVTTSNLTTNSGTALTVNGYLSMSPTTFNTNANNSYKGGTGSYYFGAIPTAGGAGFSAGNSITNISAVSEVTEASSGNHPLISQIGVKPVKVTGGAATVTDTASVYVEGSATTTTVSGNNYSLWIDDVGGSGKSRLDGTILFGTGTPATGSLITVETGSTTNNTGVNVSGWVNDYLQVNVQNRSTSTRAESGYSATADNGTATSGFAWVGINNSLFNSTSTYSTGGARDVTIIGSGNNMYVTNASTTGNMYFQTGGTGTSTSDRNALAIDSNGTVRHYKGFSDGVNATGTIGMVLQTTGTSTRWVATSTLGIGGSSGGTTKVGVASKAMTDASGNQVIAHGLGSSPKKVRFSYYSEMGAGTRRTSGTGEYDGTTNACIFKVEQSTGDFDETYSGVTTSFAIEVRTVASTVNQLYEGTVTWDATNFTIAWTRTNTPSGTIYFHWEASN